MSISVAELKRGRIVYGLYPFAAQFPVTLDDGAVLNTVEDYAQVKRGQATVIQAEVKLRPLLLLHGGTRGAHEDVACLRINSVQDRQRESSAWERIERHEHSFFFHLPQGRYGLPLESVLSLTSVGTVHKSAILGPRHVGELNRDEMQIIAQRLVHVLGLDLSHLIAERAKELLRRAGIAT